MASIFRSPGPAGKAPYLQQQQPLSISSHGLSFPTVVGSGTDEEELPSLVEDIVEGFGLNGKSTAEICRSSGWIGRVVEWMYPGKHRMIWHGEEPSQAEAGQQTMGDDERIYVTGRMGDLKVRRLGLGSGRRTGLHRRARDAL